MISIKFADDPRFLPKRKAPKGDKRRLLLTIGVRSWHLSQKEARILARQIIRRVKGVV